MLNEPSVIALNSRTQDVLAMGHEAWQMIGRTPSYIVAVRPLRKGAITDFEVTQRMIRLLLQRVGVNRFNRPRVVICVPSAITAVEQRAVTEAARRAGAAEAHLIEQPMAAAIGAGLPINEPLGNMVIDIGGGTSEVALISLGGVVALEAVRVGSFDIDAAIQTYIRREYGIAIGERTAEEIKVTIGSAWPTENEFAAEVRGRELMSGLPKTVVLTAEEVRDAIEEPVSAMVDAVIACLGHAPPELAQDLIGQGIHLVGGGGMLRGLDLRVAAETDIPVHLVDAAARVGGARRRALHRVVRSSAGDVHGVSLGDGFVTEMCGRRGTVTTVTGRQHCSWGNRPMAETTTAPIATDVVLGVSNLEVVYNDVVLAVRGISLQVPRGRIVAVLGANGAGKTTVLRAITGLLGVHQAKVTKGTIEFDGAPHRPQRPRVDRAGGPGPGDGGPTGVRRPDGGREPPFRRLHPSIEGGDRRQLRPGARAVPDPRRTT